MNKGLEIIPTTPGVYVAFHWKSTGNKAAVSAEEWPELEAEGEEADGVLLYDNALPDKILVISIHQPGNRAFSEAEILFNTAIPFSNQEQAKSDFNGRLYMKNFSPFDPEKFAPAWCYHYSRPGIPTGKWWLPSYGELKIINDHALDLNSCLAVINNAAPFNGVWLWSSTEVSAKNSWGHLIFTANNNGLSKTTMYTVRAVAAFE